MINMQNYKIQDLTLIDSPTLIGEELYVKIGGKKPCRHRRVIAIESLASSGKGPLYLAVDVGSHSLRAGLFNGRGEMLAGAVRDISVLNPQGDHYEQSSTEIWDKALDACDEVLGAGDRGKVAGLSFDATCSLVLLDRDGGPLSVSSTGDPERNVIMWMDHRAVDEAASISSTRGEPVRYLGGVVSPEHELPKLARG